MSTIADKLNTLLTTKSDIKDAIIEKGQNVADDTPFKDYANKIRSIESGIDTTDATATQSDILLGKTAYADGEKVTGTIASQAAQTITPGTSNKTIPSGKYLSGIQTIKGDSNLKSENIKKGVSIFGVNGALEAGITNILGDAILTIGTNSALAGISLLAPPAANNLNVYLYLYNRETNEYLTNNHSTLAPDSTLQLKTAIGTSLSIFVYLGTSSTNVKQTSPVQDLVSTTAPIAPGTSERQCYIITGPNPIIAINA